MTALPQQLPPLDNPDSDMWVDEAIWGHRLHDEQSPWLVYLEFLNVLVHEVEGGRAFEETEGRNKLFYQAPKRLSLRNILYNTPYLAEISAKSSSEVSKWNEFLGRMKEAQGLPNPKFEYLRNHFHSFEDFQEVVTLLRSTSIELTSNKRWTSKFVFPYGKDALYQDVNNRTFGNDRLFFARTGELIYLMLCRASAKSDLLALLNTKVLPGDVTWNAITSSLQPDGPESLANSGKSAYLPYESHPAFDALAEDWLATLRLSMPGFDVLPHLVNLAGLHLLRYQLTVSRQLLGKSAPLSLICEVVAPKKTLVREVSCERYQENNLLPARAVEAYISKIEDSADWQKALRENDRFERCRVILRERVLWPRPKKNREDEDDYEGPSDPQQLITTLRQAAMKRHRQHVANIHRNYGREIGLVSKRGTVKLRYAPTDSLLRTLLFANVEKRTELHQFLDRLHTRYGIIFSDKEAERVLAKDEFDKKAFQANSRRLEQRLGSLGLLRRLSDGCAYVINPYGTEVR